MAKRVEVLETRRWAEGFLTRLGRYSRRDQRTRRPPTVDAALEERLGRRFVRARRRTIILDYDGTLREFEIHPDLAQPTPEIRGLLRSLAYAGAKVELDGAPRSDRVERSRAAVLDGYLSAVHRSGLLPESDADLLSVLHALELEKVLYEIRYEVNNRPDWARIPVSALLNPGEVSGA